MKKILILSSLILFLAGCASQRKLELTTVGCKYNRRKDRTEYMVFPYGYVNIPGRWERTGYNSAARQQFFINPDSVTISIAFGPSNRFEFNAGGTKQGHEFVEEYYKWESDYFSKDYNLKTEKIEPQVKDKGLLWRVYGTFNEAEWDTYFLSFEQKSVFHNFAIMKTAKWTREQKTDFLKTLLPDK